MKDQMENESAAPETVPPLDLPAENLTWDKLLSLLSPETASRLTGKKPAISRPRLQTTFSKLTERLSPTAKSELDLASDDEEEDYWDAAQWFIVVGRDGEYPQVFNYSTADEMTGLLQELEGKDVSVHIFHGLAASVSRRPYRYLIHPNGQSAVPLFDSAAMGVPSEYVPAGISLEIQEDGYLGRAEMSLSVPRGLLVRDSERHMPHLADPEKSQTAQNDPLDSYEDDDDDDD